MKAFKNSADTLEQLLRSRIVILDGPMGTMIQTFKLDEAGYRGQFKRGAASMGTPSEVGCG